MSLRVTGGIWKSRELAAPAGKITRPTPSVVRQALFNLTTQDWSGLKLLDLYAGCGSVCFEALSRGAELAVAVEKHPPALKCIHENSQKLQALGVQVISKDAESYLKSGLHQKYFDYVFIDPPFENYPELEGWRELLISGGTAFFQFPTKRKPEYLEKADRIKSYGESSLAIFYN